MIRCTFPSGFETSLRHVATVAFPIQDRQILLVKRSPDSHEQPNKWTPPGGYLEHNETITEAIHREIREETGYQAGEVQLIRMNDNPHRKNEIVQNVDFVFIARSLTEVGKHDHEVSEVKWWSLDQLPDPEEVAFDHWENIQMVQRYVDDPQQFSLPIFGKIPQSQPS